MEIAILGAGGFIGSHLVEHLAASDAHHVTAVDISSRKLAGIPRTNFTFLHADVRTDRTVTDAVIHDADLVVDLVAYANPSRYVTAPLEVFELNFLQNLEIAKSCITHGKRLVQYSSAEVYGKAVDGTTYSEDRSDLIFGPVQKQRWIYGSAKALLERVLYAHGMAGDLEYTIFRPFNFLGSRIDYLVPAHATGGPRVFPHFLSALLTGGPIRLVDGGHVRRAFLHIDDGNAAFQAILDDPDQSRNQIFNVGNPANNTTVREFAHLMIDVYEELTGRTATSRIVEISGEAFYGKGYEDGDRLPPDISKLQCLGWSPEHDLRTTIRDAMRGYLRDVEDGYEPPQLAGLQERGGAP
ncbi:MAG TPA: bifunctional UDP-4-keto-pentose/UDP-xylose synthase [Gemmatimonadaceae bacterium]